MTSDFMLFPQVVILTVYGIYDMNTRMVGAITVPSHCQEIFFAL